VPYVHAAEVENGSSSSKQSAASDLPQVSGGALSWSLRRLLNEASPTVPGQAGQPPLMGRQYPSSGYNFPDGKVTIQELWLAAIHTVNGQSLLTPTRRTSIGPFT